MVLIIYLSNVTFIKKWVRLVKTLTFGRAFSYSFWVVLLSLCIAGTQKSSLFIRLTLHGRS